MILVAMILIIINANGMVIPPVVWVLFWIDVALRTLMAIAKTIKED